MDFLRYLAPPQIIRWWIPTWIFDTHLCAIRQYYHWPKPWWFSTSCHSAIHKTFFMPEGIGGAKNKGAENNDHLGRILCGDNFFMRRINLIFTA